MQTENEKPTETPKFNFKTQREIVSQVISENLSPDDQIKRFLELQNGVGLSLTDGNQPADKVELHSTIVSFGVNDVTPLFTFLWNRNGGPTLPRQAKK